MSGSSTPDSNAILKALLAIPALSGVTVKANEAANHYMDRRVLYLTGKNSGWATEPGYTSLVARLLSEMTQVAAFVAERASTLNGTDTVKPLHRDLLDAAQTMTTDIPNSQAVKSQFQKNQQERAQRIAQIAWRASAIQPEFWAGGDSALAPTLQLPALTEILDRRLHSVEVLILNDQGAPAQWTIATSNSGWKDQQRTSMFQYPWVSFDDNSTFPAALTAAGLTISGFAPAGLAPFWISVGNSINYSSLLNRVRPEAITEFDWDQPHYVLSLSPGTQGATAMDSLVPLGPKVDPAFEDFLERNLMYCDIMLATLHLEGFRFSRLRRTQLDDDFNTATAAGVTLRPIIPGSGPPDVNLLMTNGAQWFEGVAIPHDELQVGDHLVYWNNQFVRHILGSAWGLENSFVTRVGSDGYTVMLTGHGMSEKNESNFAEEMYETIQKAFKKLRKFINDKFAANPALPSVIPTVIKTVSFQLVKWSPFGENFVPNDATVFLKPDGAWWIRLKLAALHDDNSPVPSMAEGLAMIPQSLRVDLTKGMTAPSLPAGDFDPDYQESVYLPISVPYNVPGGWSAYINNPKGPGATVTLIDLIPDGTMVPGFYLKGRGNSSTIPVLRPKAQIP